MCSYIHVACFEILFVIHLHKPLQLHLYANLKALTKLYKPRTYKQQFTSTVFRIQHFLFSKSFPLDLPFSHLL